MEKVVHKPPFWFRGFLYYLRCRLRRMPALMNLEFTKRCNARCGFCACWQVQSPNELDDYSPVVKFIRPVVVSISGGEPLIRKNYDDIIRKFRPYCHFVSIITNGRLLNEESARRLYDAGVDNICVSLDYIGDKHDEMRRIKGLYSHIEDIVPKLTSAGYKITLNTVIMDTNLDDILPLTQKARDWGARISFSSYCALKRDDGAGMIESERLRKLDYIISELMNMKRKGYRIKSSDYYLERIPKYFREGGLPNCMAGIKWIQVTPDGFIQQCSELPRICFYKDYAQIPKVPPECRQCWYSCRGEAEAPIFTPRRFRELVRG